MTKSDLNDELLAQWEADSRDCPEPISLDRKVLELIVALRETRESRAKMVPKALSAGFETGWAAACLQVAEGLEKSGAPKAVAASIRHWADTPPQVDIVEGGREKIPANAELMFQTSIDMQEGTLHAAVTATEPEPPKE